jgi:hypothetical protein
MGEEFNTVTGTIFPYIIMSYNNIIEKKFDLLLLNLYSHNLP